MGIWDRFGKDKQDNAIATNDADEQAIARYRYMLKTAPPETIEQAHAQAFAALTPEQRRKVLQLLAAEMPEAERAAVEKAGDSPGALAQAATRAEIRQPGAIERAFNGVAAGPSAAAPPGIGGMIAGSMFGSLAGTVLGSMVAQHFFGNHADAHGLFADDAHRRDDWTTASDESTRDAFDSDVAGDVGDIDTFDV